MGILSRMGLVFARQWIGGTKIGEAIDASKKLNAIGEKVIINYLGEDITNKKIIESEVRTYLEILLQMKSNEVKGGIAIKPTQLGLDINFSTFAKNCRIIIEKADKLGIFVWLDMEDYQFVDPTIKEYLEIIKRYSNVGICIQSKLRRSLSDLRRIVPKGAIVRLVKGAYTFHGSLTYNSKHEIDQNYTECMDYLFIHAKSFMIATHDDKIIRRALGLQKKYKRKVMFGMLKGIRQSLAREMVKSGKDMYIYVPFGNDWIDYSTRRLREREHSMLVLRSIFQR